MRVSFVTNRQSRTTSSPTPSQRQLQRGSTWSAVRSAGRSRRAHSSMARSAPASRTTWLSSTFSCRETSARVRFPGSKASSPHAPAFSTRSFSCLITTCSGRGRSKTRFSGVTSTTLPRTTRMPPLRCFTRATGCSMMRAVFVKRWATTRFSQSWAAPTRAIGATWFSRNRPAY